jgi:glycosyltransferase involved in cell wall biosynthesis
MNKTGKSIKRVFIADPSFQDWLGHYASYDFAVREGLEKAGVETIILTNKAVTVEDAFMGTHVAKVFSRTGWGVKTAKYRNKISHKILILLSYFFMAIPFSFYFLYAHRISMPMMPVRIYAFLSNWLLPPVIVKMFHLLGSRIKKKLFALKFVVKATLREIYPPHWVALGMAAASLKDYYELVEALNKYGFGSGDILFVHMITNSNLPIWSLFASRLTRQKNGGKMVLLFRYSGYLLRPDSRRNKVWFRIIEKGFDLGCLRGATDSDLLAREYAKFLIVPLVVYPIPHIPKYTVPYDASRKKGTLNCVSLGNARDEKGIMEIFEAIRILNAKGYCSDFFFSLQVHNPDAASAPEVERFRREAHPNVELYREPLLPKDYAELIARSDVVIVPYWDDIYASRTSGVMLEALVSGKIIVTAKESWMEYEAQRFRTGAEFVPSRDPEALAQALRRITQNPEPYFGKAARAALKAREFHNQDKFAVFLLNGLQKKPLRAGDSVLICYPWTNLFNKMSGGSTRTFYLSKILDEYNLTFFTPWQQEQSEISYQTHFYDYNSPMSLFRFYNHIIVEKILKIVDREASFFILCFRDHIRDRDFRSEVLQSLLESKAVIVEYPFYMKQIAPLAKGLGIPVLMTAYDRHAPVAKTMVLRKMIDKWEKEAARQADMMFTVSAFEHEYFRKEGIENILVPSTCDIVGFKKKLEAMKYADKIIHKNIGHYLSGFFLFVGSLHGPNVEAKEAIKRIAAQTKAKGLPWYFVVAGGCANPEETVDNFYALGRISEELLIALYAQCSLLISPLPSGTGASVKTVEAMGIGQVIFGSGPTFRGLSVSDGVECFIEDNLDNYIPRLETLLLRPDSADILKAMAEKAAQFAAWYDYRICLRPYAEFLNSWDRLTVKSLENRAVAK